MLLHLRLYREPKVCDNRLWYITVSGIHYQTPQILL